MKCHIPGLNVKILGRAIHSMAKIGDELYLESVHDGLIIRAINSAESAYCMVIFKRQFFTYYNPNYFSTSSDQGLKCMISMKSALKVFKSPSTMDKQVDMCEIKLDPEAANLVFQLKCKQGVVKTHRLFILDCKKMEAAYSKDAIPNRLIVLHKVLSEAVGIFQQSEDQVTFEVTPQQFLFRNYVDSNDTSKLIKSQISLNPVEFETYSINQNTVITFSMKEFRAVLTFAESLNIPMAIHFETTGKPVVFILNNAPTFEANFVMATERLDSGTQFTEPVVNEKKKRNTTVQAAKRQKNSMPAAEQSRVKKKPHLDGENDITKCLDEDSDLFNFIEMPEESIEHRNNIDISKPLEKTLNGIKMDSLPGDLDNIVNNEDEVVECDDEIPVSPINNTQVRTFRNVFKRCFEATFNPSRMFGMHVLAEDSDDDD